LGAGWQLPCFGGICLRRKGGMTLEALPRQVVFAGRRYVSQAWRSKILSSEPCVGVECIVPFTAIVSHSAIHRLGVLTRIFLSDPIHLLVHLVAMESVRLDWRAHASLCTVEQASQS
jgi:hypothetical protein